MDGRWCIPHYFEYLGPIIASDDYLEIGINTRLQLRNRCYIGLRSMFDSKIPSIKLEVQLYVTLIRPVGALHGSETWTSRKNETWSV